MNKYFWSLFIAMELVYLDGARNMMELVCSDGASLSTSYLTEMELDHFIRAWMEWWMPALPTSNNFLWS